MSLNDREAVDAIATALLVQDGHVPFVIGDLEAVAEQAWAVISDLLDTPAASCRVCGCTEDHACPGGCYWIAPQLCSRCDDDPLVGFKPFTSTDAMAIAALVVVAPILAAVTAAAALLRRRRRHQEYSS